MTGRTRSWIAILTGFLALAVLATWPLARHIGSALPNDLGDPLLNAWILGWDADRVLRGFQGLWNAPILYPEPRALAFSEHLLGIAIPVAPVVWLTGNAIAAYNTAFILTYVLAAAGMFLLARSITKSTGAAVIAGLAFAFCPARSDQIMHLQVLASGWMPICLWGLHGYFETGSRRSLAVSAAAFAWQALSNLYFLYFLALPVAVVLAFECASRRDELRQRIASLASELVTAGVAVLIVLAPVVVVYLDVRRAYGFHRSYGDLLNFSADVSSYFHVVDTVRLWARWLAASYTPERQVFPGLIVIALAAVSLRGLRSRSAENGDRTKTYVLCYLTITVLAFLLSLGPEPSAWGTRILPFSPYLWLTNVVPGLDGLRAPARFAVVVQLGLCVLAAIGCASAARRRGVAVLLAAVVVAEGWAAPIRLVPFDAKGRASERSLYAWLASLPRAGVLELPIKAWDVSPTLTYQYATLFHHHQIVNGYSGYGSTLQAWLGGPLSPLRDLSTLDTTLDALRAVGIRYVIVHPKDFDNSDLAERTLDRLRELSPMMEEVGEFEDTTGFMLRERRPTASLDVASTVVPADRFRATASDRAELLSAAFDRDPDSRWSTEHGQRGGEWVRIDFDRPIPVAGIRLQLASRSVGDHPRGLSVTGVDEQGAETVLYDGPVLAELAKGLVADGDYPWMDIPLAASGPLSAIILKQTGVVADQYWSIHELQILAR